MIMNMVGILLLFCGFAPVELPGTIMICRIPEYQSGALMEMGRQITFIQREYINLYIKSIATNESNTKRCAQFMGHISYL